MSAINKKIISESIRDSLRSEDLSLVLGKTSKTPTRSVDDQEELLSSSSAAFKIDARDVYEAIKVPKGLRGGCVWKTGSTKKVGTYTSQTLGNSDENNWSLFYGTGQHGNILFIILSLSSKNRRELESDPVVINEKLTDVSGNIATTQDGNIMYCAVQQLPDDWVTNNRTHYIPIFDVNTSLKEKEQYHTSNKSNATAICGAGNEQRCGTCCLYHSTGVYDSVAGVTFSSGDLYKCVESKCYQCIELANSLGMRHVFNKWLGVTGPTGGTGGRCLSCDSTNFPEDCGPCPCSVDWNETSYYENILNDMNVSSELSQWKNAHYEKNGNLKYGSGSVSRVSISLSDISKDDRKTSLGWKNREKFVPFAADASSGATEPVIHILTYKDGNGDEYIDGIAHPSNHGNGLGDIRINEDTWLEMFPNIPISNLRIDVIPNGGFASNLNSIFDTGSLLSMTISKDDIEKSGSIQKDFNVVSIQRLKDSNNNNALSGLGPSQKWSLNMGVVLTVHKKLYTFILASDLPAAGKYINPTTSPYAKGNHKTTTKQLKVLASQILSNTTAKMEISTSNPDTILVGDEFIHSDTTWVVEDISSSVSYGGVNIDKRKSDILHLDKTNIDISSANDPNYASSFRFDIFWGKEA